MLRKLWTAMCLTGLLLGFGAAVAQEDETVSYIIDTTGNRHEGIIEKKGNSGDLLYKKEVGPTSRTFNKGTYTRVYTPKPAAVAELEKLFSAKKYDDVVAKAPAALGTYDWLGWGGRICYLQGKAHLAKGKVQEAKSAFLKGQDYGRVDGTLRTLQRAEIEIRVTQGSDPALERDLKRMAPDPFKYKVLGMLAEAKAKAANNDQNLLTEAALQYMKVALVYAVEDGGDDRRECFERLIDVLKQLKDNRYETFAQRLKQEYP